MSVDNPSQPHVRWTWCLDLFPRAQATYSQADPTSKRSIQFRISILGPCWAHLFSTADEKPGAPLVHPTPFLLLLETADLLLSLQCHEPVRVYVHP